MGQADSQALRSRTKYRAGMRFGGAVLDGRHEAKMPLKRLSLAAPFTVEFVDRLAPFRLHIGLILSGLALMGAAKGVQSHFADMRSRATTDLAQAHGQLSALVATPPIAGKAELPFVERLPASQDANQLLPRIQHAFASTGVSLITAAVSTEPASKTTLGKQRIALTVNGSYAAIKSALAEALARMPSVKLLNLTLRTPAAGAELDGQIELLAVSKPLLSGPAASSP